MPSTSLIDAVRAVLTDPDISEAEHRFGAVEFRLGRRELGHLHGERLADLPFPRRVRDELIAAGRAEAHHALPDSGWVSRRVRGPDDVAAVAELFVLSYERATAVARPRTEEAVA